MIFTEKIFLRPNSLVAGFIPLVRVMPSRRWKFTARLKARFFRSAEFCAAIRYAGGDMTLSPKRRQKKSVISLTAGANNGKII